MLKIKYIRNALLGPMFAAQSEHRVSTQLCSLTTTEARKERDRRGEQRSLDCVPPRRLQIKHKGLT